MTAVCASSLPFTDAPVFTAIIVFASMTPSKCAVVPIVNSHRLCDRWSSGGPAEETAEWMAVTRARSASQPGAGADSSTPNPGKPFGTRSPLYRCWPHRSSTSGGNDAGVLRKLGPQKPKAPPVATLFLRWSSAAPAVSHSRRVTLFQIESTLVVMIEMPPVLIGARNASQRFFGSAGLFLKQLDPCKPLRARLKSTCSRSIQQRIHRRCVSANARCWRSRVPQYEVPAFSKVFPAARRLTE